MTVCMKCKVKKPVVIIRINDPMCRYVFYVGIVIILMKNFVLFCCIFFSTCKTCKYGYYILLKFAFTS